MGRARSIAAAARLLPIDPEIVAKLITIGGPLPCACR